MCMHERLTQTNKKASPYTAGIRIEWAHTEQGVSSSGPKERGTSTFECGPSTNIIY